ncbi:MAG: hypothetical protein HOE48_14890 [Candidatus Latescibacteria bacterium]|jgi:hypothetical protein|nr:hypothetical protein [Candidatus Latescibacterota bacterium]MBT4139204.1 hypothetical protein [Candidatus Latescibacterota bacterium]MBT5829666.1 hypothetical protein [Candidatus Latescibacterota bacterium]
MVQFARFGYILLILLVCAGFAQAQLLEEKPVSTGGDPVGTWRAVQDPLKVYAAPSLVAAVMNLQFTGETTGTLVLEDDGRYQTDYITVSSASGSVSLGLLGDIPFEVVVADTNRVQGTFVVSGPLLILTSSSVDLAPDTLSFSATSTALELVFLVPLGEFAQSLSLVAPDAEAPSAVITLTRVIEIITADFDGSGTVDFIDFVAFAQQFGRSSTDADFELQFDLNHNGSVDFGDFVSFAQQFGLMT